MVGGRGDSGMLWVVVEVEMDVAVVGGSGGRGRW